MWRDEMDRIRCLTISSRSNTLYAYAFSTIQCVRGVVTISKATPAAATVQSRRTGITAEAKWYAAYYL